MYISITGPMDTVYYCVFTYLNIPVAHDWKLTGQLIVMFMWLDFNLRSLPVLRPAVQWHSGAAWRTDDRCNGYHDCSYCVCELHR
jgi:hypothetical protein